MFDLQRYGDHPPKDFFLTDRLGSMLVLARKSALDLRRMAPMPHSAFFQFLTVFW